MADSSTKVERGRYTMEIKEFFASVDIPNYRLEQRGRDDTFSTVVTAIMRAVKSPIWKADDKEEEVTFASEPRCMTGEDVPATWWSHLLCRIIPYDWKRLRRHIRYRRIETMVLVQQEITKISRTEWSKVCPHIKVEDGAAHWEYLMDKEVGDVS